MKVRWLVIPASSLLLAALWLAVQLGMVALGNAAWRSGDPTTAEARFSTAVDILLVERWVAPFDRGVARHDLARFDEAATDFSRAAELAPEAQQCMVKLNWAWSLEASGDALGPTDPQASRIRYLEADAVLAGANCSDQAPSGSQEPSQQEQLEQTRERLESKRTGNPPPEEPAEESPDQQDGQEQQLQERQEQAQREFQEAGDDTPATPPSDGRRTW